MSTDTLALWGRVTFLPGENARFPGGARGERYRTLIDVCIQDDPNASPNLRRALISRS